jgi:hypothetical protein
MYMQQGQALSYDVSRNRFYNYGEDERGAAQYISLATEVTAEE